MNSTVESPARVEAPWAATPEELLQGLETTQAQGLSAAEVSRRLKEYGPNLLRHVERRSVWSILCDQFANLIVVLLLAAAAAAFAFDEPVEGFAVLAVIVINAAIGFFTERRAVRSMEALRDLGQAETTVRRDGAVSTIPASELVPGDIVVLEAGDVLTADVRLLSASRLQLDESPLTGESLPVDKGVATVSESTSLAERTSMLHKGTAVTRGTGEAVVVSTGMATELGLISALVEEAEPEATPLEKRLAGLARRLIGVTLAIAALTAVAIFLSGRELFLAVETSIALAVATIPEGLPIVATVALARGMWRMARQNALVEQLAAVETLGSTTMILTDKTGTLTENKMTVVELRLARGEVRVEGTGLSTDGRFLLDGAEVDLAALPELEEALRIAALCNNATLGRSPEGEPTATGDPTEVALLVVAAKAGIEPAGLEMEFPEIDEIAFDPETKRMATLHGRGEAVWVAVKGAPETILEVSSSLMGPQGSKPLTSEARSQWFEFAETMAARGERVLALAVAQIQSADQFDFKELELVGLVGFFDPPRIRVRAAIDECQAAGIRLVMVTGDHGQTGWTVATEVGLIDPKPGDPVAFVDGRSLKPLDELSESEKEQLLGSAVIARASPQQKLDLIELHQLNGEVVAMTGDGVNDAPALKKADIGIAMGIRGTQVAREAADMVLRDDELGTIVTAVAQGRAIFANIRKFVVYLMSCNVSEIFVVGLGAVTQGPLPILPLQILFLNLVTDVFPALALGVCRGSPALMTEPPRDPRESIVARRHWQRIFGLGGVMAASVLSALWIARTALELTDQQATSVTFLTLAIAQLWHVFNMRNYGSGWIRNEVTENRWVWLALGLCLGLLLLTIYWSPLATVLSLADPGLRGWSLAFCLSLIPLLAGQLNFLWRRL